MEYIKAQILHAAELMILASHQTFSGQIKHLSAQTKLGQTDLLYIINGEVNDFKIEKQTSGQFSVPIVSTDTVTYQINATYVTMCFT